MKKYYLSFLFLLSIMFLPGLALAANSGTIVISPSTYNPPATVLWSSAPYPGNGAALYFNATGTPICYTGALGASGNVWSNICGGYSSTSTLGTFQLIQETFFGCGSAAYATCVGGNNALLEEADFLITSGGGGGGGGGLSTTTPINDVSSTQIFSGYVLNEVVALPLYLYQNYESSLVGLGILIAFIAAIFAMLKWFDIL